MEHAVAIYQALPPELWALISASIVSPVVLWIKHKWRAFFDNKPGLVVLMLALTSAVPGIVSYILTTGAGATDPSIAALHTMVVAVTTQPVYFGVVKWIYRWWLGRLTDELALSQQARSAIVPPEGLPGVQVPVRYADDF